MDLTKRIIEIRESKKISKTEVAQALNIDLSNYFRVEKKGSKLTYEQIESISNALGVSVKEFLFGENEIIQTTNTKELEDLRKENESLIKDNTQLNKMISLESEIRQTKKHLYKEIIQNMINGFFLLENCTKKETETEIKKALNDFLSVLNE